MSKKPSQKAQKSAQKLSLAKRLIHFLQAHSQQKFTARQIAEAIGQIYAADYQSKRAKFDNEKAFIQQIVAEIGSQKKSILKLCPDIVMQDQPRPRLYWHQEGAAESAEFIQNPKEKMNKTLKELDLYPQLMQFLADEWALYCLRIDEKRSKNNRGKNGNQWLHPDVVAMQALDQDWSEDIRQCVKLGSGQNVALWSFEVKLELNGSNVRECFFQAVSNSSWANEGYLVTAAIIGEHTEEELRILSALHGIGVIVLNTEELSESEILLPAKRKNDMDWQSVNRLVAQNKDFATFIEYVLIYYQSGKIVKKNWNK